MEMGGNNLRCFRTSVVLLTKIMALLLLAAMLTCLHALTTSLSVTPSFHCTCTSAELLPLN